VDLIEAFVRTGKAALDMVERQTAGNTRETGAFFLNSVLFREKMGDVPRYPELVKRLATAGDRTR